MNREACAHCGKAPPQGFAIIQGYRVCQVPCWSLVKADTEALGARLPESETFADVHLVDMVMLDVVLFRKKGGKRAR